MLTLLALMVTVVTLRCGRLVTQGRRTPAQCVSVFLMLTGLVSSLKWVIDVLQADIFDTGHLVRCDQLFRGTGDDHDHHRGRPTALLDDPVPDTATYELGLVRVDFAYGGAGATPVLTDCTLHFQRGERIALVGPVGSGKSTVLRLLLGLYVPRAGDCYCGGQWYAAPGHLGEVRRRIGYVPQVPVLFDRSVLDNVMYGNEDRVDPRAAADLIAEVGLADRLQPHGVHTRAGKGGMHLSGGQRQLVWCLRVLLQDPPVLLMDEPTAAMDADTTDLLLALLDRLMHGRTVVLVSHDPRLVDRATRRIQMTGGGGAPHTPPVQVG